MAKEMNARQVTAEVAESLRHYGLRCHRPGAFYRAGASQVFTYAVTNVSKRSGYMQLLLHVGVSAPRVSFPAEYLVGDGDWWTDAPVLFRPLPTFESPAVPAYRFSTDGELSQVLKGIGSLLEGSALPWCDRAASYEGLRSVLRVQGEGSHFGVRRLLEIVLLDLLLDDAEGARTDFVLVRDALQSPSPFGTYGGRWGGPTGAIPVIAELVSRSALPREVDDRACLAVAAIERELAAK